MPLKWWPRRRNNDIRANVDDEIRFHLQERIETLMSEGLSREAAAAQAQQEFGDTDDVRRRLTTIDARIAATRGRWPAWHGIVSQDLRHAARALAAAPGFTLLVVTTLALGIGVNGAIFGLVDRLFLRPPSGVGDPAGLTRLYRRVPRGGPNAGATTIAVGMPYPGFHDIAAALPAGTDATAYADRRVPVGRGEEPPVARVAWIAPRYFSVLRAKAPALGRYPTDDESAVDRPAALVVISYAQWMARHGGDPAIIGTTVELSRTPYTIVGVAPPGFAGIDVDAIDYWATLGALPGPAEPPWYRARNTPFLRVLIRRGAESPQQVADMATAAYRAGAPAREASFMILAGPLSDAQGPMRWSNEVAISARLVGVALLVLLIACANVANLLLARALERRGEVAIRLALGVSRLRLIRLFLVESFLLSAIAAVASTVISVWGGAAIRHLLLPDVTWAGGTLDVRVLLFTVVVAIGVTILTGLPPALRAGRHVLTPALKGGVRDGGGPRSRARTALLAVQLALSLVLVVGAGAFVRSLLTVQAIRTGYETDRLLLIRLRYDDGKSRRDQSAELLRQLLPDWRVHAGVEDAALTGMQPLSSYSTFELFRADGSQIPSAGEMQPSYMAVSPRYFHTTGIALLGGRDVGPDDIAGAPPVMVVNQAMANALWPGQDAIGQCARMGKPTEPCVSVVGIVENTHRDGLIEANDGRSPLYLLPTAQSRGEFATPVLAVVRSANPRATRPLADVLLADLRRTLPAGVYASVTPLTDTFTNQLRPWVLGSTLFVAFGLLALVVASIGTYSALAYSVSRRTREMGIRLALGAPPLNLLRLVVGEGLVPALTGIVIGIGLALLGGRAIAGLLYRTSPYDPVVLAAAAGVLLATAVLGCLMPALRATRVDPITILRSE